MPTWRPFTWVILAVQLAFAIWLVVALATSDTTCAKDESTEFCQAGKAIGLAIGVMFILVAWALIDVILGVSWVVTNDNLRTCPDCGRRSKNGWLVCPGCGYDFVAVAAKNCPECAESIRSDAEVCRYCGHDFSVPVPERDAMIVKLYDKGWSYRKIAKAVGFRNPGSVAHALERITEGRPGQDPRA